MKQTHTYRPHSHIHTHVYMHMHTHIHDYTHTCLHAYTLTRIHDYTSYSITRIHAHMHSHVCAHLHSVSCIMHRASCVIRRIYCIVVLIVDRTPHTYMISRVIQIIDSKIGFSKARISFRSQATANMDPKSGNSEVHK